MARSEGRTLSITAKLIDLMTRPLGQMQGKFLAFGKSIVDRTKGLLGSIFNLKTAVLGLATSFVSLSTVKTFGEQADALLKLANSTGDTVENLSELQAAFELAGVDADNFRTLLRALETQARKAQTDGNDKLEQSFSRLGISIRDLQSLGPSQLFEKMAAGLESFGTAQEKSVALGEILPKQFLDSLPLLEGGLRSFQDGILRARANGATVTREQAKAAEQLNDSLTDVQQAIGGVSRALIAEFGPAATAMLQKLAKSITENKEAFIEVARVIADGMVKAFGLAGDAVIGLVGAIESIPGVDLIDESKIRSQISVIKSALAELSEARSGTSTARKNEILGILGDPDQIEQIGQKNVRRLREELERLDDEIIVARNSKWIARIAERESEMQADLRDLELRLTEGLAGSMQRARDKFGSELSKVADQVRAGGPSTSSAPSNGASVLQGTGDAARRAAEDVDAAADATERLGDEAAKAGREITEAFHGDFFAGFSEGAHKAIVEITNFQAAGENAAQTLLLNGFNGLSDAFADIILGTKSAKEAFRDFARAMLSDLARITTRLLIVQAIQGATEGGSVGSLFGFAKGGVMQGTMGTPMRAFANGGVTNGPTVALFGEGKKREAFVPLPDNRTIPVTINGGRGMGGGDVHVHFAISAVDAPSVQRLLVEQGKTIAAVVAEQAGGANVRFRQQMARATR